MIQIYYQNKEFRTITYPTVDQNRYTISEYGFVSEIRNGYPHLINPFINLDGYFQIRLRSNGKIVVPLVSRLVAWEWLIKTRDINLTVDHLDGNKFNNHWSNLEWVTAEENLRRAYQNRLKPILHPDCYKTYNDIDRVCFLLANTDLKYEELCKEAGLNLNQNQAKALCSDILSGLYWTHISCKYDFSRRLANRRKFITPEQKDIMYQQYLDGFTYEEIYRDLYNKELETRKQKDSFNRVMQRVIQRGSSTN